MIDADIMGLSKLETIDYVKSRLGLNESFSESSYKKFRAEALNDESNNIQWIAYYARQGFVEFYRKRITEMEMIQKETLKQWHIETNKPVSQKDKRLILSLIAEFRANNQQLTSLGMVTPIIATIKNIIDDKDKKDEKIIGNGSKFNNNNDYYDYYDESTTTDDDKDYYDPNRKF